MYFNIIFLLILSGFLAYSGDVLGRKIGKWRLSFLGMRPKNTAIVISIVTGMITTIITLFIVSIFSEEARIALFKIDEIRREREEFTGKLNEVKNNFDSIKLEYERSLSVVKELNESKESLKAEIASMEKTLEIKKREKVVFQPDELIDYVVITSEIKINDAEKLFTEMIERIRKVCIQLGVKVRSVNEIWAQLKEPLLGVVKNIKPKEELVVYLKTTQRVMEGEFLDDVNVQVQKNRTIYKKGQVLTFESYEGETKEVYTGYVIDGSKPREHIKIELIGLLNKLSGKAKEDGLIIEPLMGFDSIKLHDIINKIKEYNCKTRLNIEISDDVSIVGPFSFLIQVYKL
ncbi:MAG: DUF3084 domain-containing protein [Candidatus Wallbacteria bacterium]